MHCVRLSSQLLLSLIFLRLPESQVCLGQFHTFSVKKSLKDFIGLDFTAKFISFNDDFSSRNKVFSITRSIYGVHLSVFPTYIMDVLVFSLILPLLCWLLALCNWLIVNSSSFRILKSSHAISTLSQSTEEFEYFSGRSSLVFLKESP